MNKIYFIRDIAGMPKQRDGARSNHSNVLKNIRMIPTRIFLAFVVLLTACEYAQAHVFLDHAEPKVGSHFRGSPKEVKIWFTGDVESAFSKIEVFGGDGAEIDKKDSHVDAKDKTLLIVSLPPLVAGEYKVVWHAVATDTHKTSGDFKFTIEP